MAYISIVGFVSDGDVLGGGQGNDVDSCFVEHLICAESCQSRSISTIGFSFAVITCGFLIEASRCHLVLITWNHFFHEFKPYGQQHNVHARFKFFVFMRAGFLSRNCGKLGRPKDEISEVCIVFMGNTLEMVLLFCKRWTATSILLGY